MRKARNLVATIAAAGVLSISFLGVEVAAGTTTPEAQAYPGHGCSVGWPQQHCGSWGHHGRQQVVSATILPVNNWQGCPPGHHFFDGPLGAVWVSNAPHWGGPWHKEVRGHEIVWVASVQNGYW